MLPSRMARSGRARLAMAGPTLALAVALAAATSNSLIASVTLPATVDELAAEADAVVHVRVARVEARQAAGTLRVERLLTLDVLRTLKGAPGGVVQLVLPGGTFGRYRTVVPGVPDVADGDEAVVFLRGAGTSAPRLVGFSQGFLRVRIDAATGQRVVGSFSAAGADGPIVRGATGRGPQPLARLEARIAQVVLAQVRGRR
ncbi:MAG: hypothetical protein ABIT71_09555 [Vicinamibacteraceae bacterium]